MNTITDLITASVNKKILLKFGATWCNPCKMMGPIIQKISSDCNIEIYSIDIDSNSELSSQFDVKSLPTMILIQDGKEIKRCLGFQSYPNMKKFVLE